MTPQKPQKPPKPPKSLDAAGKAFWRKTLATIDGIEDEHALIMLESAASMLDRVASARADIAERGCLTLDRFNVKRENPSCQTERQCQNAFRLLCRELGLTDVE